jgi:chromosome segregation ATPase
LNQALEQRRSQLTVSEQRIAAFEARAAELAQMTEAVDARIADLAGREALVQAVRGEVAGIHEISARSKADFEHVEAHRNDIAGLRELVDEALAGVHETAARLAQIESRRKLVDEVQLKTGLITNMLEDVRLNLDTLGEHKAVVDHAMENVAQLTGKIQEAQKTLRALQAERELAERIERGIKQVRKTSPSDEKAKRA